MAVRAVLQLCLGKYSVQEKHFALKCLRYFVSTVSEDISFPFFEDFPFSKVSLKRKRLNLRVNIFFGPPVIQRHLIGWFSLEIFGDTASTHSLVKIGVYVAEWNGTQVVIVIRVFLPKIDELVLVFRTF